MNVRVSATGKAFASLLLIRHGPTKCRNETKCGCSDPGDRACVAFKSLKHGGSFKNRGNYVHYRL